MIPEMGVSVRLKVHCLALVCPSSPPCTNQALCIMYYQSSFLYFSIPLNNV